MKVFISEKHLVGHNTLAEKADAILAMSQDDLENMNDEEVVAYGFILKVVAAQIATAIEDQTNKLKALVAKSKEALGCISNEAYPLGIDASLIGGGRVVFTQVTKDVLNAVDDMDLIHLLSLYPTLQQFCNFKIPKKAAELALLEPAIEAGFFVRSNELEVKASSSAKTIRDFDWGDEAVPQAETPR